MLKMVTKYAPMWEERLGRTEETEHRIDLNTGSKTAHEMPYRQGLEMREEAEEVKEQLDQGVR